MNQHCTKSHCAYCTYRRAAGTLMIRSSKTARSEPVYWTCARDALAYYADQPTRATFTACAHP